VQSINSMQLIILPKSSPTVRTINGHTLPKANPASTTPMATAAGVWATASTRWAAVMMDAAITRKSGRGISFRRALSLTLNTVSAESTESTVSIVSTVSTMSIVSTESIVSIVSTVSIVSIVNTVSIVSK
jgi:hypothetical protein